MEGKGWFIIYGFLLLLVVYIFIVQLGQNGKINDLQYAVIDLRQTLASPSASPTTTPSPTPVADTPQTRDQKRKNDLLAIQRGLVNYQKDLTAYPGELEELSPKYLPTVPQDPLSPKYAYRYKKTSTGYTLTCVLEDKNDVEDTKGDPKRDGIYTITEKTT